MKKLENFTVGYDIGITSVGWSILDNTTNDLVEFGTRSFEQAEAAGTARLNRSARRTLRRKKWRLKQLKQAFVDFELITKQEVDKKGYLEFTATHKNGLLDSSLIESKEDSIYHLRKKALTQQISTRELLMCLYNIVKTRGHFLLETVDFTKSGSLTPEMFYEKFYELSETFVTFIDKEKLENEVLSKLYLGKLKDAEIKKSFKENIFVNQEDDEFANIRVLELVRLINGNKVDLKKIEESFMMTSQGTKNIIDLKKKTDELNSNLLMVVDMTDMLEVSRILKEYNYLCEKHVEMIDSVAQYQQLKNTDPSTYDKKKKEIQSIMNTKKPGERLKVVKNIKNVYPNGLYVKEVIAILEKQKEYNSKITEEFIEVCAMITRARIPYYIGPLSSGAKNSWISRKDGNFKYSYEYSAKQLVNEHETVKRWKEAMISRCTYLPEEYALPKASFIGELFSILNEINILRAVDKDGQIIGLTQRDKIKIIDELFLKQSKVKFSEVKELLDLHSYGPKNDGPRKQFNKGFTLYHSIVKIIPALKIETIEDILKDSSKIDELESVIMNLCLFDEEISKYNYFKESANYPEDVARKLSKLNAKDYMSVSKKFITNAPMDAEGHCMLEKLFEDNGDNSTNEQMSILNQAVDKNGNKIDYSANKYKAIFKNNSELGIHLLIDDNKPFMPIARPVVRALNQCFKVHNEIIKLYGVPTRVVLETARDMKDMDLRGKVPAKHFDEMKSLHKHLKDQLKEKSIKSSIENFEELEGYLEKNKKKIELYIRQNGLCLISGKPIYINKLGEYEIDHILPRGFGDNSMNNSLLLHRDLNKRKGDRTPIEFIVSTTGEFSEKEYKERVNDLLLMKLISEEKKERLFLEDQMTALGFIERNLVDTRYIIKEFTTILNAYSEYHGHDTRYASLKAGFTGMYRRVFEMYKSRDVGLQHHAHDAAIITVVDKVLNALYPNYDRRGNNKHYSAFLEEFAKKDKQDASNKDKNIRIIRYGYKKAFDENWYDKDSFISQIKERVPLISYRVDKKSSGKFFDATIYSKNDKNNAKEDSPLKLMGINDDMKNFSKVNCAAVDFYKLTDKKGKKKHFAIHIPKVIVDQNGKIDEEKYKILIKDHYKYNALLDEENNIKTGAFKLRMFKGEVMFDTERNQPVTFNIGSIAEMKLETKIINIYSYNDIACIKGDVLKKIGRKVAEKEFSDEEKINFVVEHFKENYLIDIPEKFCDKIIEAAKNSKESIYDIIDLLSYYIVVLRKTNQNILPPTVIGQNRLTANQIKAEDSQYVKCTYSPLGIRIEKPEVDKVVITGPRGGENHFKLVKKEKFSWTI